jgi:hypothetical protein
MDFQTVIFNRLKEIFTEATYPGTNPIAGTAVHRTPQTTPASAQANPAFSKNKAMIAAGATVASAGGITYGANKLVNTITKAPTIYQGPQGVLKNPLYNPQKNAPDTSHFFNSGKSSTPVAPIINPADNLSTKLGNASDQMGAQIDTVKAASKNAIGHAADFATVHPGVALGAGAVGAAAWLARRRALKRVSKGF